VATGLHWPVMMSCSSGRGTVVRRLGSDRRSPERGKSFRMVSFWMEVAQRKSLPRGDGDGHSKGWVASGRRKMTGGLTQCHAEEGGGLAAAQ
jgi:hypothetical protein